MNHIGQIISLVVAVLWTVTAIYSDKASHRIGSMSANVFRLTLSTFLLALILWVTIGHPYPIYADAKTWLWLALSAVVGYVFRFQNPGRSAGRCRGVPLYRPQLHVRGAWRRL